MQTASEVDAGTAAIADRFAQLDPAGMLQQLAAAPAAAGPGIEVDAAVHLNAGMGRAAAALERMAARSGLSWQECHPYDLPNPKTSSAAGAIALTDNSWGPREGWAWDMRRVTVAGLTGPTPPNGGASSTTSGSATSPGAAAVITSQALAAGTYAVQWTVVLSGTLGAGDANNLQLTNGATQVATSLNAGAAGTYGQQSATVVIPSGGATLAVKSIAAATVGGTYAAQLTATPLSGQPDVVTVYKAGSATGAAAIPSASIDNVTGAGSGSDLLITQKGAFLMLPGDVLLVAGTVTSSAVLVNGSGTEVALHKLPEYLK